MFLYTASLFQSFRTSRSVTPDIVVRFDSDPSCDFILLSQNLLSLLFIIVLIIILIVIEWWRFVFVILLINTDIRWSIHRRIREAHKDACKWHQNIPVFKPGHNFTIFFPQNIFCAFSMPESDRTLHLMFVHQYLVFSKHKYEVIFSFWFHFYSGDRYDVISSDILGLLSKMLMKISSLKSIAFGYF